MNTEEKIANYLLQSKAIKLKPSKPFTWASGWKSPIYCDNRKTLSHTEIRNYIKSEFVKLIRQRFTEPECIAGVATGAIAQGALVADAMELPFVYVRASAKSHGMENLVEGDLKPGQKVIVVEDLISTGGSSIKAVRALREAGADVLGLVAIFTYGFAIAEDKFSKANCTFFTLSNYNALISFASKNEFISENDTELLKNWRKDPENWMK